VRVRHGRPAAVRAAGHPRGTSVEVRDLFGAVPARRKFLRADATEAGHVAEAVTLLALARPETGFRLSADGRALVSAPPVADRRARVFQLLGEEALERLAPVERQDGYVRVSGFVPRAEARPAPRPQLRLFVNGRPVRDRAIAKAVAEGIRAAGVREPKPEGLLFVELPAHLVDVNVHPAKSEVRFADARAVFGAVERAVREALSGSAREAAPASVAERGAPWGSASRPSAREPRHAPSPDAVQAALAALAPAPASVGEGPAEAAEAPGPRVLGQHRSTYIVATDGEELVLVDQHTAHERVRYEALVAGAERRSVPAQRLLVPQLVRLEPRLLALVEAHAEQLALVGFEAEPFGGGSLRLSSVPEVLGTRAPGPALEAILRDLLERDASEWAVAESRQRLTATLACHSAVRAGEPLALPAMAAIVRALEGCEQPALCPHGRPTRVRIPREDVARWFGRSGWRRQ
jgi:DNA mismatch repair protein MutL